jgi:Mrp family chromosome partitioning ATPase/capsular polysaccharide biosynthesis protein
MATRLSQGQDDFAAEPRSIDLRDYALVARRRRAIILAVTLLGAALGLAYGQYKGHTYAATAAVVVAPVTQGLLNPTSQANLQISMSTEQQIAQSAPVAELAARLMHSTLSEAQAQAKLSKHLTVAVPQLSNLLQFTWQGTSPTAARQGADAFAAAYLQFRHNYLSSTVSRLAATLGNQVTSMQREVKSVAVQLARAPTGSGQRQSLGFRLNQLNGELKTVDNMLASLPAYDVSGGTVIDAARPLSPSGLSNILILILGALLGLLAGMGAAFVRDAFDDRLHDPAGLERKLGAGTLAVLPGGRGRGRATAWPDRAQARRGQAVVTVSRPGSRAADAIRSFRATLAAMGAGRNLRIIVVVGADASVSSSHVAADLGVALAESGRRTLLVAADIRNSALPRIFDLANTTGLTNLLAGDAGEVLTQHPKYASGVALPPAVGQRLAVISNGPRLMQPLSVLDSKAMVGLLRSRRESFDFVVLDSPPADDADDFAVLAGLVDGVVVVACEARTRGRVVENVRKRLDQVGANLIGGVFVARGRALERLRSRPGRADGNIVSGALPAGWPEHTAPGRAPAMKQAARTPPAVAPDRRDVAPDRRDVAPDRRDLTSDRRDLAPERHDSLPREARRLASPPS